MSRPQDDSLMRLLPVRLAGSGFNAAGVLSPDRFDAIAPEAWRLARLLPGARSVVVLATGGPHFFRSMRAANPIDPESQGSDDPIDAFAETVTQQAANEWCEAGWETRVIQSFEQRADASGAPRYLDFVALGVACGLGSPSRLGLLLHPIFGPWLAIRSLLVTARELSPTAAIAGADPCVGCPAPCTRACPAAAPQMSGFDTRACGVTRALRSACRPRCEARHACVVGQEHAYDSEAEAHHMLASLVLHPSGNEVA